VVVRLDRRRLE